jgi:hypothetical protein
VALVVAGLVAVLVEQQQFQTVRLEPLIKAAVVVAVKVMEQTDLLVGQEDQE